MTDEDMDAERGQTEARIREAIRRQPPMPALCGEVARRIREPNADFGELAEKMRMDPGVTMNVLKLANSTYFGGGGRVDSLRHAFVRLGARRLFQLVVAQGVASRMASRLVGYGLEPGALLRHSLCVAMTAEALTRKLRLGFEETIFTAGLLHDMGKPVMDAFVLESGPQAQTRLRNEPLSSETVEMDLFGITHAEVGSLLMTEWGFPIDLAEIVRAHHRIAATTLHELPARMVRLADGFAACSGFGGGSGEVNSELLAEDKSKLRLDPEAFDQLAEGIPEKAAELENMLTMIHRD